MEAGGGLVWCLKSKLRTFYFSQVKWEALERFLRGSDMIQSMF